jgi:hypothetical protein
MADAMHQPTTANTRKTWVVAIDGSQASVEAFNTSRRCMQKYVCV